MTKNYYKFCAPIIERVDQKFDQLLQSQKAPIVMMAEAFSIFDAGKIRQLNVAGVFGFLVVGIYSDEALKAKWNGPVDKSPNWPVFAERALRVASVRAVQAVVQIDSNDASRAIKSISPNIFVNFADHTITADERSVLVDIGAEVAELDL